MEDGRLGSLSEMNTKTVTNTINTPNTEINVEIGAAKTKKLLKSKL